ncbi:dynamin family protein [Robertmurraya korlensis]|uniref:dynamin family protein n=1 Tax=Robertmurraya korlensis TaxID=519977 RepID=UPI002040DDAE|nr:dynamin family protein [Robertmurraya korlensis]MCM3599843.1 dynamin family protein [Robertmurraya korlensis]
MSNTIFQHDTQSTLSRIANLHTYFLSRGNEETAQKAKQLAIKLQEREYAIAFCGHFSAGKSTMINTLIGENILPSSPIPTSANLVKVKAGEDYAKVYFNEGRPLYYKAPYDYSMVKTYCKNGDEITSIEISKSNTKLTSGTAILDTPGIDSTDDAHRIATESALHLADLVFYCMDYNHVQSEVNFMFTKELTEEGKEVFLVVNQIDKHREEELSFLQFQQSVKESFASWGVKPGRIFYTTLKEPTHPHNELKDLQSFIAEKVLMKDQLLELSVTNSLNKLIQEQMVFEFNQNKDTMEKLEQKLSAVPEGERNNLQDKVVELQQQLDIQVEALTEQKRKLELIIIDILKNAYLMPFQTRELAEKFLESRQREFKVGLLFSKNKTEQERQERLHAFFSDMQEKVKSQLEWHLKDAITRFLKQEDINSADLLTKIQEYSVPFTSEFLLKAEKKDARLSGEYVLNYTNDLAESLKNLARRELEPFMEDFLKIQGDKMSRKASKWEEELKVIRDFNHTWSELKTIMNGQKMSRDTMEQMVTENIKRDEIRVHEIEKLLTVNEEFEIMTSTEKDEAVDSPKMVEKTIETPTEEIQTTEAGLQVRDVIRKLKTAATLLNDVPGFKTTSEELTLTSDRLAHRGFTIALFGAFSAGKSSFANALIGQKLLPVSPNPTTAAINKIMPVTEENKHGLVKVNFKKADNLLEEVKRSLHLFELSARSLDHAVQVIQSIDPTDTLLDVQGKVHYSFLTAFLRGYEFAKNHFGETLQTQLEEFADYVAKEEKSCFVESIELYYDCELTRNGITLVDTPGADSINARHTGVAFDYIKNSDAILFVTYYNHAFSKADREFLIQLGRVKDTFSMDKMFFLVNAIDLARDEEEVQEVLGYVTEQLIQYGIRMPHVYPVSSMLGLKEKIEEIQEGSRLAQFEERFYSFIEHDLTEIALNSALSDLKRVNTVLNTFIHNAKLNLEEKESYLLTLQAQEIAIGNLLRKDDQEKNSQKRLNLETDELAFYIKQRVFYRFNDFFKEAFNPSLLKDDGRSMKQALQRGLEEFLTSIGYDFAQELRATSLRIESFIGKLVVEVEQQLEGSIGEINKDISFHSYEKRTWKSIEFHNAFENLEASLFKKALSYFKNPKSFFERNDKRLMMEELEAILSPLANSYVEEGSQRLKEHYQTVMNSEIDQLKEQISRECLDYYKGLRSALNDETSINMLEETEIKLEELLRK